MRSLEIAKRYARGLYQQALEQKAQDRVFEELRTLEKLFSDNGELKTYLTSPAISRSAKEQGLKAALSTGGFSQEMINFVALLAYKNRLNILVEIAQQYQVEIDAANNIVRGVVESALALNPSERQELEKEVRKVTKKEVLLSYKTDPQIIGGMVARVGGYTFDDTIRSHLNRMGEDLKRSTI